MVSRADKQVLERTAIRSDHDYGADLGMVVDALVKQSPRRIEWHQ